jgi:hypothetical protein
MQSGGGQLPIVQIVVQCTLSVAAKWSCHLDFIEKEFWLIARHLTPVAGHGVLNAFSGLSYENHIGWSL